MNSFTLSWRSFAHAWNTKAIRISMNRLLIILSCIGISASAQTVSTPTITVLPNDIRRPLEASTSAQVNCATVGVILHYTIDGSEPIESDLIVPADGKLAFSSDLTLKVRAWKGVEASFTASASIEVASGRVAAGDFQSFAISPEGYAMAWGKGDQGRLGDGSNVDRGAPVDLARGENPVSIASGREFYDAGDLAYRAHSLLISKTGDPAIADDDFSVWGFGNNTYGQLGTGSTGGNEFIAVPVMKRNTSPSSLERLVGISGISIGTNHSVAVGFPDTGTQLAGGYVWTWGADGNVQRLGDGSTTSTTARPYAMRVVKSTNTTDYLNNIVQVAAGVVHSLALDGQGKVWAWGSNEDGQLGANLNATAISAYAIPVKAPIGFPDYTDPSGNLTNIKFIAAGARYSLAVTNDGKVFGWGEASYGRIGDGTAGPASASTIRIRPVQMSTSAIVSAGATVVAVAAGTEHSLILDSNRKVWSTGRDNYEQLGNGSTGTALTPTMVLVQGATNQLDHIVDIAAGQRHSLALSDNGEVITWGTDDYGVIGNGVGESGAFPKAGSRSQLHGLDVPDFTLLVRENYVAPGPIELFARQGLGSSGSGFTAKFYANGSFLGAGAWDLGGLRFTWTNVPVGTYRILAEISDGVTTTALTGYIVVDQASSDQNSNWFYSGLPESDFATFVIPVDFQGGAYTEIFHTAAPGDPWYYRMESSTYWPLTDFDSNLEGVYGEEGKSNTPIATFGETGGGVPLNSGQSYTFALHAGHLHEVANDPVKAGYQRFRIRAFSKGSFQDPSVLNVTPIQTQDGEFFLPAKNDAAAWAAFANEGFIKTVVTCDEFGNPLLETRVEYVEGAMTQKYGTAYSTPFLITHKCLNPDYLFEIGYRGFTQAFPGPPCAMAIDTAFQDAFIPVYTLEFNRPLPWRSTYLTSPQFLGEPAPSPYWGKTVEELTAAVPYIQKQFDITSSAEIDSLKTVDNSVELLSHSKLDQVASDLGIVPGQQPTDELLFRIINFVFNEIELTDAVAVPDTKTMNELSFNAGGITRSAVGVLLERQGSPTEQCALLIYLLRKAGVPAGFAFAGHNGIKLLDSQMSKLLHVQLNGAQNAIGQSNIPHIVSVNYPWVALKYDGKWRHIFPWIKDTEIREGYDLYDYMPEGYRSGAEWARKYILNFDDLLNQAYPSESQAAEKELAKQKDNGASVFKRFVEQTLLTNHPDINVDDIGIKHFVRALNPSTWDDFPRPWYVSEMTAPITLKKTLSEVPNAFDTTTIRVWSDRNNNVLYNLAEPSVVLNSVPTALLHNRRILFTTTPDSNLTLTLAPWESTLPGQTPATETTGSYSQSALQTWKKRRKLTVALSGSLDLAHPSFRVEYTERRARNYPIQVFGPGVDFSSVQPNYSYYPQIETLTPSFVWEPASSGGQSATLYELNIEDRQSTGLVYSQILPPITRVVLDPGFLWPNKAYRWWVRALVQGVWQNPPIMRAFQTAETALAGGNDWNSNIVRGLSEFSTIRNLHVGDLQAGCTHPGRVTKEMLQIHFEEYLDHQNYIKNNPTAIADNDVMFGGLAYLTGMSYYEKNSRFRDYVRDLHKQRIVSDSAFGVCALVARRDENGPVLTANGFDYVYPTLDMLVSQSVVIGEGNVRLDSGGQAAFHDSEYVSNLGGSCLEHVVLDSVFPQLSELGGAISTIRLLHAAQSTSGMSAVALTASDYIGKSDDLYEYPGPPSETKQLKDWDPDLWSRVEDGFSGSFGEYQMAYYTPRPLKVGHWIGMGAFILNNSYSAAFIAGGYNGGYATAALPPNTMSDGRSITLDPTGFSYGDFDGGFTVYFDNPTLGREVADGSVDIRNYDRIKSGIGSDSIIADDQSSYAWTNGAAHLTSANDLASNLDIDVGFGLFYDYGYMGSEATSKTTTEASPKTTSWIADPVNTITGEFYIDSVDLGLPGPMPLFIRRNYGSQNLGDNDFGWGWKLAYFPYLSISLAETSQGSGIFNPDYQTIYAAEMDGSVVAYTRVSSSAFEWRPKAEGNPQLANQKGDTTGSTGNLFNAKLVSDASFQNFTLTGTDGSVRSFQVMSFPKGGATRTRPYLTTWLDHVGNSLTFTYETVVSAISYGHIRKIQSSNGNFVSFYYDAFGHVKEIAAGDGRRLKYDYNDDGDLVLVTFPDGAEVRYDPLIAFQDVDGTQKPYSTHLIWREVKPNGRMLENTYDNPTSRRVIGQKATVGENNALVTNATLDYYDSNGRHHTDPSFNPTELDETGAKTLTGWTITKRDNSGPIQWRHDYTKGQITKITDGVGQTIEQFWYPANTVRTPGDSTPGAYPRSMQKRTDERGLVTEFKYDGSGNMRERKVSHDPTRNYPDLGLTGDLTGDGMADIATTTITYNSLNLPTEIVDPASNRTVLTYGDADGDGADGDCNSPYVLTSTERRTANGTSISKTARFYYNVTQGGNTAKGLAQMITEAAGETDAATVTYSHDGHGFILSETRPTGTEDPTVVINYRYNLRGELVEVTDAANQKTCFAYDAIGNRIWQEKRDGVGKLVWWQYDYYNRNGQLEWTDGPRYNPEDYVLRRYDGAGRPLEELRLRSQAKADGGGVESVPGFDDAYSSTFFKHNAFGDLEQIIDPRRIATTMGYDLLGRMLWRMSFEGLITTVPPLRYESFLYEPGGNVKKVYNPVGGITKKTYTIDGKLVREDQMLYDESIVSTRQWRYYLDGRLEREILPNGTYQITTYDDALRKVTKTLYKANGSVLATESALYDHRGNVVSTTDAENYTFTKTYDRLNRIKTETGPPAVTGTEQQTTTYVYDAAGITSTVSHSGIETVITRDAIGRTKSVQNWDFTPAVFSEKTYSYSDDYQSVTEKAGTSEVISTSFTDNAGHTVLIKHPDNKFSRSVYDSGGNILSTIDEASRETHFEYNGLNQLTMKTLPGGASESFIYDSAGNLWSRQMPGGLHHEMSYDSQSRKTTDSLWSEFGQSTRNYTYQYYLTNGGKLQWVNDQSSETHFYYDDFGRVDFRLAVSLSGLSEHYQETSYEYDKRGLLRTAYLLSTDSGPEVNVDRTYDGYGQMKSETVAIGATVTSNFSQEWDAVGKRSKLMSQLPAQGIGAGRSRTFSHYTNGLMSEVNVDGNLYAYEYDYNKGLITLRSNPWRYQSSNQRDSRGRILNQYVGIGSSQPLTEVQTWLDHSKLETYTASRTGSGVWNETRNYSYNTRGQLTNESDVPALGVVADFIHRFDFESPSASAPGTGLGVLTLSMRRIGTAPNDAQPGSWKVTEDDEFLRPATEGSATGVNAYTTAAISYDDIGQQKIRTLSNGNVQTFTWDASGHLLKVAERNGSNSGFDFEAIYDALGRRIRTIKRPIVSGLPSGSPFTLDSSHDPEVEFLEIGVAANGARSWKIYGPDLSNVYGGLQGIGGLEAVIDETSGTITPVVNDVLGNTVGRISSGNMVWNPTKVGSYGILPGSTVQPLDVSHANGISIADATVWRGHRLDPTGLYYLGARYYDPASGRFLSPDPVGHGGSWSLYDYADGDPINFCDPDGRLASRIVNNVRDFIGDTTLKMQASDRRTAQYWEHVATLPAFQRRDAEWGTIPFAANTLNSIDSFRQGDLDQGFRSLIKDNMADAALFVVGDGLFRGTRGASTTGERAFTSTETATAAKTLGTESRAIVVYEPWPTKPFERGGFLGGYSRVETAQEGQILSRIGDLKGSYVSPPGASLGQRGLPSAYPNTTETLWEVVKPFKMDAGLAAPWKDAPGLGIQYRMEQGVQSLWDAGYIRPTGGL